MEVFWTLYHIVHSDIPWFPFQTKPGASDFQASKKIPQKCFNLGFFSTHRIRKKNTKHNLRGLQKAEVEEEGEQLRPPGFVMIRLPWAEEIRQLSVLADLRWAVSSGVAGVEKMP